MATVNARIDDELKRETESVLSDIGLSFSSAITIYFKQIVRERAIPFPLKASEPLLQPTDEFAEYLREVEGDILHERDLSSAYDEDELFGHLKGLRNAVRDQ